jgi:hypothetical protein
VGGEPDLLDVSGSLRLAAASGCFTKLNVRRRTVHHAVFIVANNLQRGILYVYGEHGGQEVRVSPAQRT